ncbi:hypothetical protein HZA71_00390 [Candidatus Falkowbacteria bacterium]|nr:hypothetical protein [Candidatus Falkowbacteria bacterium]
MKKINLKKIKFNFIYLLRYLYPITIAVIVIILLVLIFFLYNNVYKTLAYAEMITALKQKVPPENLEKKQFEEILAKIQEKIKKTDALIDNIKNPFVPPPGTPK